MKLIAALFLVPVCSLFTGALPALAATETETETETEYKQPYPHTTGAQLLPYCKQTEIVVDQLRCDYYVQGLADLASTPVRGVRLACPPQGMNRTELMEFAAEHLSSLPPDQLENTSAASLILQGLQKKFRCPKTAGARGKKGAKGAMAEAIERALLEKAAGNENTEKQ